VGGEARLFPHTPPHSPPTSTHGDGALPSAIASSWSTRGHRRLIHPGRIRFSPPDAAASPILSLVTATGPYLRFRGHGAKSIVWPYIWRYKTVSSNEAHPHLQNRALREGERPQQ
jgi:hypothetical protein